MRENISKPKQTVLNNSALRNTLQVVPHDDDSTENSENSKNRLRAEPMSKDNFFDNLLKEIEEAIKDIWKS